MDLTVTFKKSNGASSGKTLSFGLKISGEEAVAMMITGKRRQRVVIEQRLPWSMDRHK
jgi:hypothetical protein